MSEHKGWYRRRLPHRDEAGLIQAITFHLADSLPLHRLTSSAPPDETEGARHARIQRSLDQGWGACLLADVRVAEIVEKALLSGDGVRHYLLAWVIMPNHVHVLIETVEGWPLARVVQRWKGATAHDVNLLLGRQGSLWEREYFDRYVRDVDHLERAVLYVHNNPVKAGLVEEPAQWRFGSARLVETVFSMYHVPFERGEG